jgi:isoleucyl-tRNA synthetase
MTAIERISTLLGMYTNTKSIKTVKGQVSKKLVKPMFQKLGPAFKEHAKEIAEELSKSDAEEVGKSIEKAGYYRLHTPSGAFDVLQEHFVILDNLVAERGQTFKCGASEVNVNIDSELTEALKEDVITREFIRRVQMMRKEMKLTRLDVVHVHAQIEPDLAEILLKNEKLIKGITRAKELSINKGNMDNAQAWEIIGAGVKIAITK